MTSGFDGDAVITGYVIASAKGPVLDVGDVTSATITGLKNGTTYSFTVSALNLVGTGPSSSSSNSVTPCKATSRTVIKLSAPKVTYGQEQVEHVSVTVLSSLPGTMVTGTVTIKESTTTLCVIKLRMGNGSCALSGEQLKTGTYHLIAVYGGNASFTGSTSAKEILALAK